MKPHTERSATSPPPSLPARLAGVLTRDIATYEGIASDAEAIKQGLLVVVAGAFFDELATSWGTTIGGILTASVGSVLAWLGYAFAVNIVASMLSPDPNSPRPEFRRTMRLLAFASAPQLFLLASLLPVAVGLDGPIVQLFSSINNLVVFFWCIDTTIMAVRVGFGIETGRALAVAGIAFVLCLLIAMMIASPLRG